MSMSTDQRAAESKRKVIKNRLKPVQNIRFWLQVGFAFLCVWIGVEFHFFVRFIESSGATTFVERPPGVEGFLPISSLMSLYYFFLSGEIHNYHPAGVFILIAIILMSVVFSKAFCSWLCPVGTLSEYLADFGEKVFRRRIRMPKFLDWPLRSLKYLLLGFFVYAIFGAMGRESLKAFLDTPYNLVADVKMYYFFADISQFALIVIAALIALSIAFRGFWCRYLCPYGALLGLIGLISPNRIKRNAMSCIDCGKCAMACPSAIKVDKVLTVVSDECTSCMQCVDSCPVADTLEIRPIATKTTVPKRVVAFATVGIFLAVTGVAMLFGLWRNDVPSDTYIYHKDRLKSYGHPTGAEELRDMDSYKTDEYPRDHGQ